MYKEEIPKPLSINENHHYNIHKKFAENLNKLIKNDNNKLEEIPENIDKFPLEKRGEILYNAGGLLNHNLYWKSIKEKVKPNKALLNQINKQYQSYENFIKLFKEKAKTLVGSGYTFLVENKEKTLSIINMPNEETPYSYNLTPLFALDLWEHAYYPKYLNNKNEYIEDILEKADFSYANEKYNT